MIVVRERKAVLMDVIGGNNKKSTHIVDRPIDFNEVPDIPENLEYSDLHLLIPKGFEDLIEFELQNTTFMLTLLQGDQQQNKVGIDRSLYNPKASGTYFPKFCFEVSSFKSSRKVDYFGSHANHVLNQNQMIYMALQHRLVIFKSSPNSYTYLLSNDLKAVRSFIGNNYPKAYNAQKKVDNTWVILSPWDRLTSTATKPRMKILSSHGFPCIGEILARKAFKPLNQHWPMIFAQLPVQPSSESSLSTTAKVTVSPHSKHNQLFRSVGFSNDDTTFTSIFKHAQNLAARLKTHLIAEAFEVADSSESVFAQDWQFNEQRTGYIPRDKCLREVVVVFRKMNRDTNQFLAGEIEASPAFVDTLIHQEISKTELFDQINIEVGQVKSCLATNEFVLGNLLEDPDKLVTIKNVTQVQCLSREIQGVAGVEKVKLRVTRKAGNARIDSNTGIKGVTKCKPNLGTVYYKDESLGFPFVPDLLLGGNATKAKENTIALAKAAFAVKHGFYKPPRKGNLLNTLDPVEVNAAVQACPEFVYIDEFGQEQTAHVGIAYVRFTELASTYGGKLKELSYMFEAGRFLYQNGNKDYFKYIWSNFVKQKYIDIITELTKVQHDLGNSFPEDGLPYFSPKDIASNNIIKPEDLVLSRIASYPVRSKLLDEEWNKGFYIDLSGMSGPIIRIPSAKVLNYMVSQLPDRTWSYPNLLVRISNILNYCMYTSEDKRQRIGYIFARDGSDRLTEQVAYLREAKSILYTGNTGSQMLVQKLLKPEITGFSKKQVVDQFLPPNTCVIFDQQLYNNCVKEMYKNSDDPDYDYLINGLRFDHIRNPVLWISQYADLRVWTRDDFAHHLAVNHNIQLDQYLDTERNKDIIFIDIYSVVEKGHADNDKQF